MNEVKNEKNNLVTLYIDSKEIKAKKGDSLLQVALDNNIYIPHFCYHEDLEIDGSCRACLVEVADAKKGNWVTTSCTLKAKDGLRILTETERVKEIRQTNLELLFAGHRKTCPKCQKGRPCKARDFIEKYKVDDTKYSRDNNIGSAYHKMGDAAEFNPYGCIDCNKCVRVCQQIGINFLKLEGQGSQRRITFNKDPNVDCIYCGQCTVVCPVNAIREQDHLTGVMEALADPDKIVIAQTAPAVRASIGEEFGLPYGTNMQGQLYTAYRKLGFDKVFDVNFGADITTYVEAEELTERLKSGCDMGIGHPLPMFTSCCPGWVKTAEFYYPELLPNLTTARSPQIHSGGAYKTWWAEKEGIDPKKIVVVSIMPCTSKKYESKMDKLKIDGMQAVDYVLTTRETAALMKMNKIHLPDLEESEADECGQFTGAAAIYGASGGVMESALRTAYHQITGEELEKVEFKDVRTGTEAFKTADVVIGGQTLRIAVVATPWQVEKIVEELRENPQAYHYVEVMACAGGCMGGGGQPKPSSKRIIEERIKVLYNIDDHKTLRKAHENPVLQEFFKWVEKQPKEKQSSVLHTHFEKKNKFE